MSKSRAYVHFVVALLTLFLAAGAVVIAVKLAINVLS